MIVRRQFTAMCTIDYPEYDNAIYLDYEIVNTGLSSDIVKWGYWNTEEKTWVKKMDVEERNENKS